MTKIIDDELEGEFNKYFAAVNRIAKREFDKTVKPWLDKTGFFFATGNGDWAIFRIPIPQNETRWIVIDEDDIPERVLDVLQSEVPGLPAQDLGSLCPDYPKG